MDVKFAFAQTATESLPITTNMGNCTAFLLSHTLTFLSILYKYVYILEVILQKFNRFK